LSEKILIGTAQQCLISFGSNLGNRDSVISEAASLIAADVRVHQFAASRLFETPPIGGPDGQEPFLNAVAAFETTASAAEVLVQLQTIEDRLGRLRRQRWGARSIDLDVVLHGELIGGSRGLVVPHPRYTARRFVLRPACDVAGHYRDPRFGWTLRQLADHLDAGVPSMALVGSSEASRRELCDRLARDAGLTIFDSPPIAKPRAVIGNAPAAMIQAPMDLPVEIPTTIDCPWVAAFVPKLPAADSDQAKCPSVPRLITRLQATEAKNRWPAPHQMWPSSWDWPEYRLELDDMDWAFGEVVSAMQSMRCPLTPLTDDGNWWR
jgi:2-amino-4-hydroxy-6-hydroxymethyldihydropteridine diphosphokinase